MQSEPTSNRQNLRELHASCVNLTRLLNELIRSDANSRTIPPSKWLGTRIANAIAMRFIAGMMLVIACSAQGQLTPEELSARIRSHIPSSVLSSTSSQQSSEGEEFESSGWGFSPSYSSSDLYLTIDFDTNNIGYVDLALHGATNGFWQLLYKTDLQDTNPWAFFQILYDDGTTNDLFYDPVSYGAPPAKFFRAVGGDTVVSIGVNGSDHAPTEPCSPTGTPGVGFIEVDVNPTVSRDLTVVYSISGSAINGVDYTNLSGSVVIPANSSTAYVNIEALYDTLLEFEESVTLTLVLTNGYLVNPLNYTATEWISDCLSNAFTVVATNVPAPIGIDYFSPSNSLVLSWNYGSGEPNNFVLYSTNQVFTVWSGFHGAEDEVKVATVKDTANGFTNGDMYFGNATNIGWLSADGVHSNPTFCILTNGVVTNAQFLRGSLYLDRTGVWSNDLIAVTSDFGPTTDLKGVWQINSSGVPRLVANLDTRHLEGVITVTNDATKWGPWAGKIITGDEGARLIYAIDTNGVATSYNLGIDIEDIDIIPPSQDLYCVFFNNYDSTILRLSQTLLTNYVGDLLITQSGELENDPTLFIVNWDGTKFVTRAIKPPSNISGEFEHVTFAPINIPSL